VGKELHPLPPLAAIPHFAPPWGPTSPHRTCRGGPVPRWAAAHRARWVAPYRALGRQHTARLGGTTSRVCHISNNRHINLRRYPCSHARSFGQFTTHTFRMSCFREFGFQDADFKPGERTVEALVAIRPRRGLTRYKKRLIQDIGWQISRGIPHASPPMYFLW
jgi:hypothetical protein